MAVDQAELGQVLSGLGDSKHLTRDRAYKRLLALLQDQASAQPGTRSLLRQRQLCGPV